MTISTTHKGRTITFLEETDEWRCFDLNITLPKLSSVKRRIDELNKSERRVDVDALLITRSWHKDEPVAKPVKVTVLCEPEQKRGGGLETTECWIVKDKGERSKVYIHALAPLSAMPSIAVWKKLDNEATLARKAADVALEAIQRHTADSLMLEAKNPKK